MNVAVEVPPATVTESGTVALALLEDRLTTAPPLGARPLSVTVPVEVEPPVTVDGVSVSPESTAGLIVSLAVWVTPFIVPVIVTDVEADTPDVATVNVAVVAPPETGTLAGGVAPALLEPRLTESPPVGAGLLNVTIPVDELPPTTELGARVTLVSVGGVIVRVAVSDTVPWLAVMTAATWLATAVVLMRNVAELAPARIVT